MICPKCLVQMHQKDRIGGGKSTDKIYCTWELKECPHCGRLVKEYYSCRVVGTELVKRYSTLQKSGGELIIEPTEE